MPLKVGELYASFGIDSKGIESAMAGIETKMRDISASLTRSGFMMTAAITAPMIRIGKEILQASIDYESAFAGVIKTTDTDALEKAGLTFDDLSQSIKNTSLVIPETTTGLAKIMELGGQLGIKVTSLEDFTQTIAAMGVATNLTTESAATMFAQFANITGMSQSDFDRLGSSVVALGNNFATTESAIVEMSHRMASVGTNVGLTEAQILGWATAISSVGIEAQAGGTSFSTFASKMQLAVEIGSENLKKYAGVANMSVQEFSTLFKTDASAALEAFVGGLNDVERNGMSAIAILDDMGISEVRQRNMLIALANAQGLVSSAVDMSTEAWGENVAMLEEANKRYATTESQLQIMKNAFNLVAIDLGDMALPTIQGLTGDVVAATKAFLGMDEATKKTIIKTGALAAAIGPAALVAGRFLAVLTQLPGFLLALASPFGVIAAGFGLLALAAVDSDNQISSTFEKMSVGMKYNLQVATNNAIKGFENLSKRLPATIQDVRNFFMEVIPAAAELVTVSLAGAFNAIADNAQGIADLGISIIDDLVSAFRYSGPKIIPAAIRMIVNVFSALVKNLPKFLLFGEWVIEAIWEGLKAVDWKELGTTMLDAFTSAFKQTADILSRWFEEAKTAIKAIDWASVKNKIVNGFNFASDWLKTAILGDAATDESTWADAGSKIWESIKSGFSATGDALKSMILGDNYTPDSTWGDAGTKIWESIKNGFSLTGDWIKELVLGDQYTPDSTWGDAGGKIWTAITGGFAATGDWIKTLVLGTAYTPDATWSDVGSAIWTAIKTGFSDTGDWVKKTVMGTAYTPDTTWGDVGGQIWTAIKSGFTAAGDWIKSLVLGDTYTPDASWSDVGTKILEKISTSLSSLDEGKITTALGSLSGVMESIATNIVTGKANLLTFAARFFTVVATALSSFTGWDQLGTTMASVATAIIGAIADAIPGLATAAVSLITAIGNLLSNTDGEGVLSSMGTIGKAILDGVTKAMPALTTAASDILIAIGNLLGSADWTTAVDTASDIAIMLLGALTNLPWGDLFTTAGDILVKIGTALSANSSKIVDAALDLGLKIIEGLGSVDWSSIFTVIAELCGKIVFAVVEWFKDPANLAALGSAAHNLAQGLINGVADAYDNTMGGNSLPTIDLTPTVTLTKDQAQIEGLTREWTQSVAGALTSQFMDSVDPTSAQLATAVGLMFGGAGNAVASASAEVYAQANAAFQRIADGDVLGGFREIGLSITTDLADAIKDGQVSVEAALLGLGAGMGDELILAMALDGTLIPYLTAMFSDTSTQITALLKDEATDWGQIFGQAIPDGATIGLEAGMYVLRAKTGEVIDLVAATNAEAQVKEGNAAAAQAGVDAASTTLDSGKTAVGASADGLVSSITDPFAELSPEAKAQAEVMLQAINLAIQTGTPGALQAIDTATKAVLARAQSILNGPAGAEIGATFVRGIINSMQASTISMIGTMQTVASATATTASGILSSGAGYSIGLNFDYGIAAGISAGTSAITAAARAAASAALAAAQSKLKIHSPSQVGEKEVGWLWDQGIVKGILGKMGLITEASGKVYSAMTDEFYVGDPSRGTIYTSRQSAREVAQQTARSSESGDATAKAQIMGKAIADRLIETGALNTDVNMDGKKVGEITANPVSKKIAKKSRRTISGRSAQGVLVTS